MMKKLLLLNIFFFLFLTQTFSQVPIMGPISGPTVTCSSPTTNVYSTTASNSPTSFFWNVQPSAGVTISTPSLASTSITFPSSNATYTIIAYAMNGSGVSGPATFTVKVYQTPNITFSGANSFCQGSSTNLSASATILSGSSTISYFWSPPTGLNTTNGPNVVANPTTTTTYTVTGTLGFCSNFSLLTVNILPKPTITAVVSPSPACSGSPVTLTASGANTYTWSNGVTNGVPFTPTVSTTYSVLGMSASGCTNTATKNVNLNPPAIISVTSNSALICPGNSALLSIGGTAVSYSMNGVSTGMSAIIAPTITTVYNFTGVSAFGCMGSTTFTQNVAPCSGIFENNLPFISSLKAYPNPSNGSFNLSSGKDETVSVLNELGQVLRTFDMKAEETVKITGLANGFYFIVTPTTRIKIIITN
jgi:hypothetical protein